MAKVLIVIELLVLSLVGVRYIQKQEGARKIKDIQEEIKNWQEFLQEFPEFEPGRLRLQQLEQLLP